MLYLIILQPNTVDSVCPVLLFITRVSVSSTQMVITWSTIFSDSPNFWMTRENSCKQKQIWKLLK